MISLIIPVYNEEEVLPDLFERLTAVAAEWDDTYEVVLIDDGSQDGSWEMMKSFHLRDPRWKSVRFGRNFGHQIAISAGLDYVRGQCVVIMDADLQDPPEQIAGLLEKWREGYQVVYGIRQRREGSLAKRFLYKTFYRTLAFLSSFHIPLDAGDFCLMDRKVVDILRGLPERRRFIRGLRSWVGFKQIGVGYDRPSRAAGEAKYTYAKLFVLAIDGLTSFTSAPLRFASLVGVVLSTFSVLAAVFYLCTRLFPGVFSKLGFPVVPGFATVIISVFFLAGVQLTFLGIIGEYLARLYDEVKRRPLWTTMETLGFETGEPQAPKTCPSCNSPLP